MRIKTRLHLNQTRLLALERISLSSTARWPVTTIISAFFTRRRNEGFLLCDFERSIWEYICTRVRFVRSLEESRRKNFEVSFKSCCPRREDIETPLLRVFVTRTVNAKMMWKRSLFFSTDGGEKGSRERWHRRDNNRSRR